MTSKYQPYPTYKPSGTEWLGEVPEAWNVLRTRFCVQVSPRCDLLRSLSDEAEVSFVPMDAVGEYGGLRLDDVRLLEDVKSSYTEFEDGDVVVAKITPCFENGKGAIAKGLVNKCALGTTELHVLRPSPHLARNFLFYITISSLYRKAGEANMYGAGGQKRVPTDFVLDFRMPLPSESEQESIADFLDRETTKIDALISKQRELIERLTEKRRALISRCVTRGLPPEAAKAAGLDPHPKLKPSGVEWIGDVPEEWGVSSIQYTFENLDRRRIPLSSEERGSHVKTYPYYGASGIIDHVESYIFDEPLILVAEDGANLLSRSSPLAFLAEGKYWVNNHAHILRPKVGDIRYWVSVLQTHDYTPLVTGAAQPKLTAERLSSIGLPLPPPDVQIVIADFLDQETGNIDSLALNVNEIIERLQEYRTALITAAVTGKIDVRKVTQ